MKYGRAKDEYKPQDDHYTPEDIFEALGLTFDLDPCSPSEGGVVPARQKYSLPFDGLAAPWFGLVWVNPPYSKPSPWVDKWLEHGNGLLMVPSGKSAWRLKLWNHDLAQVINLKPPKFIRPDLSRKQIMFSVDLWAIGQQAVEALHQSKLGKVR
jgi:hypothetical protein